MQGGEQWCKSAENDRGDGDSIVIDRGECKHDDTEDTDDPGVYTSLKKIKSFSCKNIIFKYVFKMLGIFLVIESIHVVS